MPIRAMLAAMLVATCWGCNYAAAHISMVDFPPLLTVLLRFIGVSILLAPFALRHPMPRARDMLFISFTLVVLQFAMIFSAMHMGLTISSVIIATQLGVPFACIMAAIFFQDFLGPWRSGGLMVAFLGVLIVAGTPNASQHWVAFLLAILAAFSWSCANIYLKRMKPLPGVALLFWPGLFSLPMLGALSAVFEHDQWALIQHAHWTSWLGIAYSAIFSSILGYGLWNWLIRTYPMSQVVPYGLLVPVAGITAGALMFGEPVTTQVIVGAALTIIGVGIISLRRPQLVEMEQ